MLSPAHLNHRCIGKKNTFPKQTATGNQPNPKNQTPAQPEHGMRTFDTTHPHKEETTVFFYSLGLRKPL